MQEKSCQETELFNNSYARYLEKRFMQEGCCLMGAHSPEVPTIFLQAVEILDK